MNIKVVEKIGDVKIYGSGSPGGKGNGLIKINECQIQQAHKLSTRVLTTVFYDKFIQQSERFEREEKDLLTALLGEFGDVPISVRSSATDEAILVTGETGSVHAGENTSFMLPNNHPDLKTRFDQLLDAIYSIYRDFMRRESADSREKMAIVINPIPGIYHETPVGPIYYPLVSGVANSSFPYALKSQKVNDGFARIALGHGYAVVLDDFPVISMATIREPLPLRLLGNGQMFFYAIDMTKNEALKGHELETMKKLHVKFADVRTVRWLGANQSFVTFESLVEKDLLGFRSSLIRIMETIAAKISANFQIEFVFNVDSNQNKAQGIFHVVQLTQLPEQQSERIEFPQNSKHVYLSIHNVQGHGVKQNIRYAVVISPFIYSKDQHDRTKSQLSDINKKMAEHDERYIMIAPGRLGSKNREWGIQVSFRDVDRAAAIFEYGVDIAGRSVPTSDEDQLTGGVYGSHFLYMIQGGYDEQEKRLKTRMFGTQGTHFLTNLMSNNIIYGYIAPTQDQIEPWFFTPSQPDGAVYVIEFPKTATVYADTVKQLCMVVTENQ